MKPLDNLMTPGARREVFAQPPNRPTASGDFEPSIEPLTAERFSCTPNNELPNSNESAELLADVCQPLARPPRKLDRTS